ncbi:MAG: DUF1802 family protein, partial [Leptolyngbya sp. SIO3F4]|nr:DUF1802 family protein [Leptolyngbya sp. SIO3F4]
MVLLNTGLCLSTLEIVALKQGRSVVAAPQRFIAPGKRFLLIGSQQSNNFNPAKLYRSEAIQLFGEEAKQIKNYTSTWARCELCQHITGLETVEQLSKLTVWNQDALEIHLRNKGNLFLAFLRVFELAEDNADLQLKDIYDKDYLNKFSALPDYLNVSSDNPVLTDERFKHAKDKIINLKIDESLIVVEKITNTPKIIDVPIQANTDQEHQSKTDILQSPDWYTKIAEVGNSSHGNTFERLVRRSLIELGFGNSGRYPEASLDPNKLGGAGGLDFYCDSPYPLAGECKATKHEKVKDDNQGAAAQLIRLGEKNLGNHYFECIKIIFAAGELTMAAKQTARNSKMNVLRPETLQRLIELKTSYPHSFDVHDLKPVLTREPFSEEADQKFNQFINSIWQHLNIRSHLVEAVKSASEKENNEPVSVEHVRVAFNHIHTDDEIPTFTRIR